LAVALDAAFFVERAGLGIASFPSCCAALGAAGPAPGPDEASEGAGV
jgi:hypothetical protein